MTYVVKKLKNRSQYIIAKGGKRFSGPYATEADAKQALGQFKATVSAFQEGPFVSNTLDQIRLTEKLQRLVTNRTPEVIRTEMAEVTLRYNEGKLLPEEYGTQLAELIAELNMAIATTEHGELDLRDIETVQTELGNQFGINGTATSLGDKPFGLAELVSALVAKELSEKQLMHRANLYANDAEHIVHAISRARAEKPFELRMMDEDAEHCPECMQYAGMGLQPIGDLPLPGDLCTCGPNCKCNLLSMTLQEAIDMGYA